MCSATEVVLFERTTFLIIARSGDASMFDADDDTGLDPQQGTTEADDLGEPLSPERFEKISELVKAFKISCRSVGFNFPGLPELIAPTYFHFSKLQEQFNALEIRFPTYTALLEILTANTYVMIIVADPNVRECFVSP